MRALISMLCGGLILLGAGSAQAFEQVTREPEFVAAIDGKALTRFGIKLAVTPDGKIKGRAFGRNVSGDWQWKDGWFCRDLYWGTRELGYNCQEVRLNGSTIRFTSDQGTGQYADLQLR